MTREFLVHDARVSPGGMTIVGRAAEGGVAVGMTFHAAYTNRIVPPLDDDGQWEEFQSNHRSAELTVRRIKTWGHELDELGPCWVGELELDGEPLELTSDDVLTTTPLSLLSPTTS
jgi:hypothetical protein